MTGGLTFWAPITLYLFATGALWQAALLGCCGVFVISTVDNILRPILVGAQARMPDYVLLIATLGGFVIGPLIAALFIALWRMAA